MQRSSTPITTLVSALVLCAGFVTPMALADEPAQSEDTESQSIESTEQPKDEIGRAHV